MNTHTDSVARPGAVNDSWPLVAGLGSMLTWRSGSTRTRSALTSGPDARATPARLLVCTRAPRLPAEPANSTSPMGRSFVCLFAIWPRDLMYSLSIQFASSIENPFINWAPRTNSALSFATPPTNESIGPSRDPDSMQHPARAAVALQVTGERASVNSARHPRR